MLAFRNDLEKRDASVCGASAGVAAAFGAPIGGVLFALEEGASHWCVMRAMGVRPALPLTSARVWCHIGVAIAQVSKLDVESILRRHHQCLCDGHGLILHLRRHIWSPHQVRHVQLRRLRPRWRWLGVPSLRNPGVHRAWALGLRFTSMRPRDSCVWCLFGLVQAIGAGGGLIGAAFNGFNALVTRWRMARMNTPLRRLVEPVAIATTFAVLSFCLPLVLSVCRDRSDVPKGCVQSGCSVRGAADVVELVTCCRYDYGSELVTFYCPDGQYNELATLLVAPSENAIKQLFHAPTSFSFEPSLLVLFFFLCVRKSASCTDLFVLTPSAWLCVHVRVVCRYSSTTALTYGTAVPSGLFIPSLLAGSAYGRCVGQALNVACPGCFARPGLYALVGAAAVLGGMARMTISLCVILLESTGDLTFGMPLMVVLMASRWVGNVFNEGERSVAIAGIVCHGVSHRAVVCLMQGCMTFTFISITSPSSSTNRPSRCFSCPLRTSCLTPS